MQPIIPAEAAETEVVVEETEVAEEVTIAVTIIPNLIKILMLSKTATLIAVRRRRKVFVSSLLTVRTFMNIHEKCETAHRKTTLCALSVALDRILLKSAYILVITP
jgi:hypothetical protein